MTSSANWSVWYHSFGEKKSTDFEEEEEELLLFPCAIVEEEEFSNRIAAMVHRKLRSSEKKIVNNYGDVKNSYLLGSCNTSDDGIAEAFVDKSVAYCGPDGATVAVLLDESRVEKLRQSVYVNVSASTILLLLLLLQNLSLIQLLF